MRTILLTLFFFSITLSSFAQKETALARSLDSLYITDQAIRGVFGNESKKDSVAQARGIPKDKVTETLAKEMVQTDTVNMRFIDSVIKIYGYPGKTLVGQQAGFVAWIVIQHSNRIDEFMPLLKAAADSGELDFYFYAMTLDRQLMYKRQEQIYGTQGRTVNLKSGEKGVMIIWPVKDPESVDERRKQAGFTNTVRENATRMGIDYKVYKLFDLVEPVKK